MRAKDGCYPGFLYYLLSDDVFFDYATATAKGTKMPRGDKGAIMRYAVPDLPMETQIGIADTLSALDARIAENRAINNHLEQMAQAIFKSWFVDFEPFGGVMPDDWREGTISDLGEIIGGSTPSKAKPEYYTEHGIAWITPKDLSVNKSKFIAHGADDITELGLRNSSARLMPRGTVLFSSRAPIGYIAIAGGEVCTNQGFKSVVPSKRVGTAYIYYFLIENLQTIENMASGSTFKEVSGSTMKGIPAIIPDDDTLRRFQEECTPIFEKQELLEAENAHLAEIRDTLLPRLMSGELSVAEVGDAK
jgi:type I restriction enzyme S subunit